MHVTGRHSSGPGTDFNDAFYVYTPPDFGRRPDCYPLALGTSALAAASPGGSARNFIVHDIDAATDVALRPYVPAYRADHTYRFVVDLGLLGSASATPLHFGVSDGNFRDNSGSFAIDVTQLVPATPAVPEPGTLLLVAVGLLAAASARRARVAR